MDAFFFCPWLHFAWVWVGRGTCALARMALVRVGARLVLFWRIWAALVHVFAPFALGFVRGHVIFLSALQAF